MRLTRRAIALTLAGVLAAAGVAAVLWPAPPIPPDSIERTPTYQNEALLARAWSLPVAHRYGPAGYVYQPNQSVCGPTSVADVMLSEGRPTDPKTVADLSGAFQIFGYLPRGLTLDQEAEVLGKAADAPVKTLRGLSLDDFRAEMAKSNDPSERIVVNFTREPLFGRGHGHFSPVLGYLADQDLVFVGDVNARFKPWLVPTQRLYEAQNTIDSDSGLKRGVLEVEARQPL
ncbi:phytochelatin synthase [Roseiarcus fermentans]|uniref:glutathione gamma-glutamylcysteinyltransferase n=1 Tax=Roseiarcus fermentans TaxID=1473586 RepID=A0A366EY76_9HYPH|nr:phytochelatin synthase family protein [Roseiarcus fermentans]RBP06415.1 phytochelatin synthase [Roseiarcus fermentans]